MKCGRALDRKSGQSRTFKRISKMEIKNETTNQEVVYEVQEGGGGAGPRALEILLELDNRGFNIKDDIVNVHVTEGVAGYLPIQGAGPVKRVVPKLLLPRDLAFFERSFNSSTSKWEYNLLSPGTTTKPDPGENSAYSLKKDGGGNYYIEPY